MPENRKFIHGKGFDQRWQTLTLAEQMGNIGSEISRALKWEHKDSKIFQNTVNRALELFDLTISDSRWRARLKEICRAREIFCDIVFGENQYKTTLADLDKYFIQFAVAARKNF